MKDTFAGRPGGRFEPPWVDRRSDGNGALATRPQDEWELSEP